MGGGRNGENQAAVVILATVVPRNTPLGVLPSTLAAHPEVDLRDREVECCLSGPQKAFWFEVTIFLPSEGT